MDGEVQITDFGMHRIIDSLQETYATMPSGNVRWQAPENLDPDVFDLETSKPTMASDVWAFSCTCIEVGGSLI